MPRTLHSVAIFGALVLWGTASFAQAPIGEVFAADSSMTGSVLYAGSGTPVMSGSQVAAGGRAALLKLARGGEVRICPSTSIVVSASPNGRNLLFSLNEGEIEFHFDITSESDAVQTPDFRLQFAGPGRFDLAMCMDKQGGLALRGNNSNRAAIVVREMMGDGVYQVPAGQSVDFVQGSVQGATPGERRCGCPEAEILPAPNVILSTQPALPAPPIPSPSAPAPSSPTRETLLTAPPPPIPAFETHMQVDAPFIYRGDELKPEAETLIARLQTVRAVDLNAKLSPTVTVPAPPPPEKSGSASQPESRPEKKSGGFFKKLGSFFGKIFKG